MHLKSFIVLICLVLAGVVSEAKEPEKLFAVLSLVSNDVECYAGQPLQLKIEVCNKEKSFCEVLGESKSETIEDGDKAFFIRLNHKFDMDQVKKLVKSVGSTYDNSSMRFSFLNPKDCSRGFSQSSGPLKSYFVAENSEAARHAFHNPKTGIVEHLMIDVGRVK